MIFYRWMASLTAWFERGRDNNKRVCYKKPFQTQKSKPKIIAETFPFDSCFFVERIRHPRKCPRHLSPFFCNTNNLLHNFITRSAVGDGREGWLQGIVYVIGRKAHREGRKVFDDDGRENDKHHWNWRLVSAMRLTPMKWTARRRSIIEWSHQAFDYPPSIVPHVSSTFSAVSLSINSGANRLNSMWQSE